MNITINTDASFHPEHKVGGFAFWIVCDAFKIQEGGMFKGLSASSTQAELKCIANAIYTLLAQKEVPLVNLIVINTDSKHSIEHIKNTRVRRAKPSPTVKVVCDLIDRMEAKFKPMSIELRHVKAHSGKDDKRSYVNEWCDREAKKYMRLSLKERLKDGKST